MDDWYKVYIFYDKKHISLSQHKDFKSLVVFRRWQYTTRIVINAPIVCTVQAIFKAADVIL